jgi:MMPL family
MRRPVLDALTTAAVLIAAGTPVLRIEFTHRGRQRLPDSAQGEAGRRRAAPRLSRGPVVAAARRPRRAERHCRGVAAYAQRLARRSDVAAVDPPRLVGADAWLISVVPDVGALEKLALDSSAPCAPGRRPVGCAWRANRRVRDHRGDLANRLPLAIAVLSDHDVRAPVRHDGVRRPADQGARHERAGGERRLRPAGLRLQDGRLEGLLDYTSRDGLEITQPLVLLAIVFGLSTDYGVFLLTRIKEAPDAGASNEEAVAIGIQRTGRIVTAAGAAARRGGRRVGDVGGRLHRAARARHRGRDRRDDRARAARTVVDEAAGRAQLVGAAPARAPARPHGCASARRRARSSGSS